MKSKKYYKLAGYSGLIGLILLIIGILSNSAYPSMVYRVLTPLALLFIFICVALVGISGLLKIIESTRRKDYISAGIIIIVGLIFIFRALR